MSLKNKTLILTGASRGIGRAIALELAQAGVKLVLSARSREPLEETTQKVQELGVEAKAVVGDVAVAETAQELVNASHELGNFHGFIHGAGVLNPGPLLWELSEKQFRDVIDSQLTGGYQLIRFAMSHLLSTGEGMTVFVGSGAAEFTMTGIGAYTVAKAAEEHLAKQLAAETNEVVSFVYRPGIVETQMQEQARAAEGGGAAQLRPVFKGYQQQGILISPQQAAQALVQILAGNPRQFHGKVATWQDG